MSGSVSDVNYNKFQKHKNSTFKHFLSSGEWTASHMMSDFYISVVVTLIIYLKLYLKHKSKSVKIYG